ncbi:MULTISPECIES: DUF7109 family protein [Haloarcula]|uniref:Uncharacterized protein n=1 Tax=Haloarcula pellucida TaxID=1427151 RepID=A0A830GGI8_9EURY|nr:MULTISPECIES: hypothetical protein [Halomicroarcula]MBX0346741.1 hypothetical protein [Halomicroarcula pellucida]MDS0277402.1 hypothetical protein [Halomicroarcula sp. S1AR25-4]GGN85305.1 hypothetical protein GCM10009030_01600 [Halomicroarcula pellucida]
MDLTADDLAGVVDLFGALTRTELGRACSELAFKAGEDVEADAFAGDIEEALTSYHLLSVADHDERPADELLVVGPAAFPSLPEGAGDLPHIMDVPDRTLADETVARAAESQFREDAVQAVQAGDEDRIASLLDASYDLEAWGAVELDAARDRLDDA